LERPRIASDEANRGETMTMTMTHDNILALDFFGWFAAKVRSSTTAKRNQGERNQLLYIKAEDGVPVTPPPSET
jgi:hypothetical protein